MQDVKESLTTEYEQKMAEMKQELQQNKEMELRERKRITQQTEAQARHMTSWHEQNAQEQKRLRDEALKQKRLKEQARKDAEESRRKATTLENKQHNKEYKKPR